MNPSALLLHVPVTDPTSPYHSLVYLASSARSVGFTNITVRDTNLEALLYCAKPGRVAEHITRMERRRSQLLGQAALSRQEEMELLHLTRAMSLTPGAVADAWSGLQSQDTFYDYSQYRKNVNTIQLWLESLSCFGYPGQYSKGFNLLGPNVFNLNHVDDLCSSSTLERIVGPLAQYFHSVLIPEIVRDAPDIIGINITYVSQLPYALWLLRQIRQARPESYIVCGGTETTDVWKYLPDKRLFGRLFSGANACVIGEGESAFVELLKTRAGTRPAGEMIPNVVVLDGRDGQDAPQTPPIRYENLDHLPAPEYDLLRSQGYLSPELMVYYSPTRGCYWNKCTFCDYGLNFGTPTSPWRQRSLDRVLDDLTKARRLAPFIYLSVDVLAPSSLLKLAQAMRDHQVGVKWAAEIRLERYFDESRCRVLAESGCVAVSVGFESGNQRILDSIVKGTRLDDISRTIRSFADAGIAVQMMGFTGFPTESREEALESVRYLETNRNSWTVAGLGTFSLTPGAIVAQRPADFGITAVSPQPGDDIQRFLLFQESRTPLNAAEREEVEAAKDRLNTAELGRPFAGGIDSTHSVMYYSRYGRRFPDQVLSEAEQRRQEALWALPVKLNGVLFRCDRSDLHRLFNSSDLRGLLSQLREQGKRPDAEELSTFLQSTTTAPNREPECLYFIRWDGLIVPCPDRLGSILSSLDGSESLQEVQDRLCRNGEDEQEVELTLKLIAQWQCATPDLHTGARCAVVDLAPP